ncbi:EAL domain-containing protein [Allomesorhizobium camelthorni]|uniref:EAL domain-containing protein n=1 Tax=Allomesorhizobium camelthorni TaxID=475069 RepID=A0A6G4WHY4_9HYPH|nr:EAL domain-containing protein [Mesorhizobium camelthorni]NGO53803.1 EAL domain-containing protein [Mesorhizobium camelthorni]
MPRGLSVVASAALLCGLCYYFLQGMVGSGRALEEIVLATCAAALTLAVVAAAFSLMALVRANASDQEIRRLALSVEVALRDFSARSDGDAVTIGEIDASLSRRLDALSASLAARHPRPPARSATVVPHPAVRLQPVETGPEAAGNAALRAAIQRALAADRIELDLQPIVSISQGMAVGHDAVGLVEPAGGEPVRLGRADFDLPDISAASCERLMVFAAAAAIERRSGHAGEATPLHVAISGALLDHGSEFAAVLTLLGQHPALSRSIILSVPAAAIADGQHGQALALLAETGARLAAEGWSGSPEELEAMHRHGVSMLKLPAAQLLDPTPASAQAIETLLGRAAAANLPVVATDVAGDEDAVRLIDLGVNLMAGPRFAGRSSHGPEAAGAAERFANL